MPSASHFSSIEDHAFDFAPPRREAGRLGVVAASGRRAPVLPRAGSGLDAPAAVASTRRAPGLISWLFAGFGAWALLIGARAQIVTFAPATAPLYAALGLKVNLRHMGLDHVVSRLAYEDGRPVLIVEGEIRNFAATPRVAPRMRLSVLDAGGREIYHWIAAPPKARLAVGETAEFRARLAAPPKEGQEVRVRFGGGPESPAEPW
ncbi:hypothetical protein [Rhodoblastus sp.]|uniref:hypothetical protein n=1 Tax=Rhodoblastus sp. TaxID=1962975 RepID=UPI003F958117